MNELITNIIDEAIAKGFGHFGIRAESKAVSVGDSLDNSFQNGDTWDGEELDGTCAIRISYDGFEVNDIEGDLAKLDMYKEDGVKIILVGGTSSYEGTDAEETVISNAEVIHVF